MQDHSESDSDCEVQVTTTNNRIRLDRLAQASSPSPEAANTHQPLAERSSSSEKFDIMKPKNNEPNASFTSKVSSNEDWKKKPLTTEDQGQDTRSKIRVEAHPGLCAKEQALDDRDTSKKDVHTTEPINETRGSVSTSSAVPTTKVQQNPEVTDEVRDRRSKIRAEARAKRHAKEEAAKLAMEERKEAQRVKNAKLRADLDAAEEAFSDMGLNDWAPRRFNPGPMS